MSEKSSEYYDLTYQEIMDYKEDRDILESIFRSDFMKALFLIALELFTYPLSKSTRSAIHACMK
jgi:hypothetical protein